MMKVRRKAVKMMSEFLFSLLSLSAVMSAVVIAVVFILRFCSKIPASVRYAAWILILIRLAFPVSMFPPIFEVTLNDNSDLTDNTVYQSVLSVPPYPEFEPVPCRKAREARHRSRQRDIEIVPLPVRRSDDRDNPRYLRRSKDHQ